MSNTKQQIVLVLAPISRREEILFRILVVVVAFAFVLAAVEVFGG